MGKSRGVCDRPIWGYIGWAQASTCGPVPILLPDAVQRRGFIAHKNWRNKPWKKDRSISLSLSLFWFFSPHFWEREKDIIRSASLRYCICLGVRKLIASLFISHRAHSPAGSRGVSLRRSLDRSFLSSPSLTPHFKPHVFFLRDFLRIHSFVIYEWEEIDPCRIDSISFDMDRSVMEDPFRGSRKTKIQFQIGFFFLFKQFNFYLLNIW